MKKFLSVLVLCLPFLAFAKPIAYMPLDENLTMVLDDEVCDLLDIRDPAIQTIKVINKDGKVDPELKGCFVVEDETVYALRYDGAMFSFPVKNFVWEDGRHKLTKI